MKNILTILKELGIEVPKDKEESLNTAVAENYKTVADYDKQKEKLDAANETIKANDTAMKDLQTKLDEFKDVDVSGLNQRIKDLETEKEKMRSNLLRAVSHDLRTPLTGIIGAATTLLENGTQIASEDSRRMLMDIQHDAEWLIHMVENLLSVTKITGGTTNLKKQDEIIEEIVGEAVGRIRKRFPDSVVNVSVPEEMLIVPMDATLIEQVLINLMENAVQHGKTTTRIELRLSSADGLAVFEVADNGCGIEKELLPHLFEGYLTRDQEEISDQRRNMGIGLSVCMSIVQAHGGTMRAENRKKGGALLQFSLPLEENSHEHQR